MAVPQHADFEEVLSSLTVVEPQGLDEYKREVVVPASVALDVEGKVSIAEHSLWFKPSISISFDAIVMKVQTELTNRQHKSNRQIAIVLLAIACLRRMPKETAVASLNRILDLIQKCHVTQTFLFPAFTPQPVVSVSLGQFCIQILDADKLRYRCEYVCSEYFDRHGNRLRGRLSIDRSPFEVQVIHLFDETDRALDGLWRIEKLKVAYKSIEVFYFELLARDLILDFRSAFFEEQYILIASGAPYFDERLLSQLPQSEMITIFVGIGGPKSGAVLPTVQDSLTLPINGMDVKVKEVQRLLASEFGFKGFSNSWVHQTIRTYTRFMSKAERHLADGRTDEGFLHYVIALDLVFGEKDSSTKSVSQRVACITHRALGKSFAEQLKQLNTIYDHRSKYVHLGHTIAESSLGDVQAVCKEVLWCLLRLQKIESHPNSASPWLENLDYFAAAEKAERSIDDKELQNSGIAV